MYKYIYMNIKYYIYNTYNIYIYTYIYIIILNFHSPNITCTNGVRLDERAPECSLAARASTYNEMTRGLIKPRLIKFDDSN